MSKRTTTMFDFTTRTALLAGVAAIALPSVATAQTADPDADAAALEEEGQGPGEPATVERDNLIIVTASKRETTLQETPISVNVTSGETLEQAQIRDLLDLQTVAPSLRVSQLQSSANTTFIIRGFGNGANNVGIEPSVGVFIDGVFRSRSAAQINDLANVQRVEVLNGPQSTLFGKNASAGVISVITREPQFDFSGQIEATYGNFDQRILKANVTGPITDTIAASIEGNYNKRDGYVDVPNLNTKINDRDRYTVRGQLLFEPSDTFKIRAIGDYSKIDELCCFAANVQTGPTAGAIFALGGQLDANNPFGYTSFSNILPENDIEAYGGSLQADLEFGALTLTSITAYRELTSFNLQDVDFSSADIVNQITDQSIDTFTQELRIASDFDGPINFLLGGFFFDESIVQDSGLDTGAQARQFFSLLAGNPQVFNGVEAALGLPQNAIFSPGPLTRELFTLDNQSYSIFGTVDFELTDRLTLTAGFNYTDDEKDFTNQLTAFDELGQINLVDAFITLASGGAVRNRAQFQALPAANQAGLLAAATGPGNPFLGLRAFQFQPPFVNVPNAVEPGQTRDDDLSYTLRAAYELTDEINTYFSYATGFKASSVNLSRDSRPAFGDFIPGPLGSTFAAPSSPILDAGLAVPNLSTGSRFAGPEDAEVYELGIKAQFDRIGFNLALFDQTLEGFQSFAFTGTGFALTNAGAQSTRGFELDTTINPVDPLVLTFALTYLDANFDDFTGSAVGDLTGRTPAGIPEFNISTSATYIHEFGNSGTQLVTRIDYNHESNVQIIDGFTDRGSNAAGQAAARAFSREVNLVNTSISLQFENGFEISAYARNLLDDEFLTAIFPGVAQAGTVSGYPSQPRTYGGTVRFKF